MVVHDDSSIIPVWNFEHDGSLLSTSWLARKSRAIDLLPGFCDRPSCLVTSRLIDLATQGIEWVILSILIGVKN